MESCDRNVQKLLVRFVGEGRRLGADGRRGEGRAADGHWTRSWGYSSRGEVGGMRGLTPCPPSPSAPPLEVGEVEHYSQPGAQPPYYTGQVTVKHDHH